jgi:hypothetical protein
MAQAQAEDAAFARTRDRYGVSFKQGHRHGWRDGIEWVVRSHRVHWVGRVVEVWPGLLIAGVVRTPGDVDNAIQSAREALHDEEYVWLDPDSDAAWGVLEPHVYRFLDLTDTELERVA